MNSFSFNPLQSSHVLTIFVPEELFILVLYVFSRVFKLKWIKITNANKLNAWLFDRQGFQHIPLIFNDKYKLLKNLKAHFR